MQHRFPLNPRIKIFPQVSKYRNGENAKIPHASIEVQMGIFTGKKTQLLFLQGIRASVKK